MKNRTAGASQSDAHFHILDKLILSLLLAAVLLFVLYPLLCIVKQSVTGDEGFSLAMYESIFGENLGLLKNSVFVALLSAALSTVLAVAVAFSVRFTSKKIGGLLMGILLVSMVSPPFISSLAYIQLFGRNGMISKGLLGLSLNPYGWQGVVIMQSLFFTSLNALLLIGMLERIDLSLLQASADLGATRGKTLYKVVVPLISPSLLICFLLSFIRSMADFGTPIVIGGRFETVATEIYMQIIGYSDLHRSSALNVLLLIPALLGFILYRYLMKKNDKIFAGNNNKAVGTEEDFRIKGPSAALIYVSASVFFATMLLVYGSIFLNSFSKNVHGDRKFTFEYLEALFERNMDTFIRSVVYALIVALVGTFIGILLSYYVERRKIWLGNFVDFIVTMPYMLPGSCFGIGYILAFNHSPLKLTGTALIVIANMIFKQLSITTKAVTASLAQISLNIDDAARDLGANQLQVFKDILLPNLKPAFATGFVNNFTSAMITAGSVIFLITPGQKIAVFTLFDSINTGKYGEASMISTFIILITVVINIIFYIGLSGGRGRRSHVFGIKKLK